MEYFDDESVAGAPTYNSSLRANGRKGLPSAGTILILGRKQARQHLAKHGSTEARKAV